MPPSHVSIVARVLARQSAKSQKRAPYTTVMMTDQEIAEMNYFNDREEQWLVNRV